MARGSLAKESVAAKIQEAFGESYIGEFDKKIYVWANDGGERVQIAISLTCPKNMINTSEVAAADKPFEWSSSATVSTAPPQTQITEEEKNTLEELVKRLGL